MGTAWEIFPYLSSSSKVLGELVLLSEKPTARAYFRSDGELYAATSASRRSAFHSVPSGPLMALSELVARGSARALLGTPARPGLRVGLVGSSSLCPWWFGAVLPLVLRA